MKIHVKAIGLELTPSLEIYIEKKLGPLSKFLKKYNEEVELWLEVARTTKHHHKGEVFRAKGDIRLPKKSLWATEESFDIRSAIDKLKDTLRIEIHKYKERIVTSPRRAK